MASHFSLLCAGVELDFALLVRPFSSLTHCLQKCTLSRHGCQRPRLERSKCTQSVLCSATCSDASLLLVILLLGMDSVHPQALRACNGAAGDCHPEAQPAAATAAPAVLAPKQPKPVTPERFPAAPPQAPPSASPAVPRTAEVKLSGPVAAKTGSQPTAGAFSGLPEASVHRSATVPAGAEAAKVHLAQVQESLHVGTNLL